MIDRKKGYNIINDSDLPIRFFTKESLGFELDPSGGISATGGLRIVGVSGKNIFNYNPSGDSIYFSPTTINVTGDINIQGDYLVSGQKIETTYLTGSVGKTNSFKTLVPTGIEKSGILFQEPFNSEPVVTVSMQKKQAQDYYSVVVEDIYNTGFYVSFSDVILETGFYLNTIAHNV